MSLRNPRKKRSSLDRKLHVELLEDRALLAVLFEHGPSDAVRVLVPTEQDYGDLGFDWTGVSEPFDDSGWAEVAGAPNGVGFDRGSGAYDPAIGLDVEASMYERSTTLFARAEFDVDDKTIVGGMTLRLRYDDGFIAWVNGVEVARTNTTGVYPPWDARALSEYEAPQAPVEFDISDHVPLLYDGTNVLAIRLLNDSPTGDDALLQFTLSGESREGPPLAVDDVAETLEGQPVTIDVLANDREGSDAINPSSVAVSTPPAHGVAVANFDGTITYTPNALYNGPDTFTYSVRDNSGPAQATQQTLVASDAPVRVLVPQNDSLGATWRGLNEPFSDSSWTLGTFGVGYDDNPTGTDFWPHINLSVRAEMLNKNTSVYMRSRFEIADPMNVVGLTLRMRYDDGFAAFLNGVRVAGDFDPQPLTYNSAAPDANRGDAASATFRDFDITAFRDALHPGPNVLAIHGLNTSLLSSDLLMQPELVAMVSDLGAESNPATVTVNVTGVEYPPIARDDSYSMFEGTSLVVSETPNPGEVVLGPGQFLWSTSVGGNGHVYERVQQTTDWNQAREIANSRTLGGVKGHLATITTAAEQQFLASIFPTDEAWIGAFQDHSAPGFAEPSGGWRWITGEPWTYSNWNDTEPNDGLGEVTENVVHTFTDHVWNDVPDDRSKNWFWVEYPVSGAATEQSLLVPANSLWRYRDNGATPGVDSEGRTWKQFGYADTTWSSGIAELGYGDGDEATVVNCGPSAPTCNSNNFITTWFRREFTIDGTNVDHIESLTVELLRDDGASVYINGVEVVRDRLPGTLGDNLITATVPATGLSTEGVYYAHVIELSDQRFTGLLRQGLNVVAVEVHQATANSSDVSFDLRIWGDVRNVSGLLANDTDGDGQPLSAVLVSTTAHGVLDFGSDGTFEYVPNAGFVGVDSFTYRASDGVLLSEMATVTIVVSQVPPTAQNDAYSVDEDVTLTIAALQGVLANDADSGGRPLTALLVSAPSHGAVLLHADGSFVYSPSLNYSGPDSFTYRASDGTVQSPPATVVITVSPINDMPQAGDDTFTTAAGTALILPTHGAVKNISTGMNDALGVKLSHGVTDPDFIIGAGGTGGSHGSAVQVYRSGVNPSYLSDAASANSSWLIVQSATRPPGSYFFDTFVEVPQGNVATVRITNVRHATDDVLIGVWVNDTQVYTTPGSGSFNGFTTLGDLGQGAFQPGQNRVRFAAWNAGSSASPMAFRMEGVVEFDSTAPAGVLANDHDADGTALSATMVTPPVNGTLTLNTNGTFTYVPNGGFSGVDQFTYRASDGQLLSEPTTVRIVVSPPGKAPQDLNADGVVDVGDVAFLMASYGKSSAAKAIEGDLDGDGRIGVRDAIALRNAFTPAPAPAAAAAVAKDRAIVPTSAGDSLMRADRRIRRPGNDVLRVSAVATDHALAVRVDEPNSSVGRRSRLLTRARG
jgi:hypothetical protein